MIEIILIRQLKIRHFDHISHNGFWGKFWKIYKVSWKNLTIFELTRKKWFSEKRWAYLNKYKILYFWTSVICFNKKVKRNIDSFVRLLILLMLYFNFLKFVSFISKIIINCFINTTVTKFLLYCSGVMV